MYEEPDYPDYYCEPEPPEPPERCHHATNFPETPVNPALLFGKVEKQLQAYGLVVPHNSQKMVEDLCKGFNECIRLNSNVQDKKHPQTLVFSPKTGSAKSVTAKMYIAMLKTEHSLVVVPTVEDANTFCEDINNWSGNSHYARCTYNINNNPKTEYHIEKKDVGNYRCLVITHNMYIRINKFQSSKLFEELQTKDTKLVIIDERISLYNRYTIKSAQISDLIDIFTKIDTDTDYDLKDDIATLGVISDLFKKLKVKTTEAQKSELILPLKKQKEMSINPVKFHKIGEVLKYDSIINVTEFITKIVGISSKQTNKDLKSRISELIEIIEKIGKENLSFHVTGKYDTILFTSNIEPLFGSSIVLDATATINEIYENTTYYKCSEIKHIVTADPRIYNNFTIHIAKGHPQSKNSLYKGQKATQHKNTISNYAKLALNLLTEPVDNLLIVTFKDLVEPFQKLLKKNKRISITNWGNHVGKNNWSHCNKVMIVGWHRMPVTEYYGNYINSVDSVQLAEYNLRYDTIKRFKETQLVDDLVQATMRCSARKIINADGDCAKSEAYLFYADNTEGHGVIKQYVNEFKGAKAIEWKPLQLLPTQKLSQSASNIETILDYLDKTLIDSSVSVKNSDIINNTILSKSVVNRTVSTEEFAERLTLRGYELRPINKKSEAIFKK